MVNNSKNNKNEYKRKKTFSDVLFSINKNIISKPLFQIFIWYLLISFFGALLLWLPISHNEGYDVKFIDSLFISSSSFSDTGLSTLSISETFNLFGQFVILLLINIGGIGWFTIKIFILNILLRKTIKYQDITQGEAELGTKNKNETIGLIFSSVIISLASTLIFGTIFGILFATVDPITMSFVSADPTVVITDPGLVGNWGEAMWAGYFHASSSVNNAGFDVFKGDYSMQAYSGNIGIQVLTIALFVLGGIGFAVFYDVYLFWKFRHSGRNFSFSLITKISFVTYFIVAFSGLVLVYSVEGIELILSDNAFLDGGEVGLKIWALTFNTFSTRNAGFSTMDLSLLSSGTLFIYSIMMFIGSGPGSTAGGIRTTTFAIVVVSLFSYLRNYENVNLFNRTINDEQIRLAYLIFFSSLMFTTSSILLISVLEYNNSAISFIDIMFIVFSAYGTTGLSSFSLLELTIGSKTIIIILMFMGQMGVSTILAKTNLSKTRFQKVYVDEYINLG